MHDRLALPLLALAAAAMIAMALAWPQGLGRRSPAPFGHALAPLERKAPATQPTPRQPS